MILPDHLLRLIDPRDRPPGSAGLTAAEATDKNTQRLEREEQRLFCQWLNLHESLGELTYDWSRTDKRTTRRLGAPDFVVYLPKALTLFLEFKAEGAKLTLEQQKQAAILDKLGFVVRVVRSAQEAIELTKSRLVKCPA